MEACKNANKPARTIYVDTSTRRVYHCMGTLILHADHGPGNVLSKADVQLSAGDQVRWFSTTHTFYVESVVKGKELPQSPAAPETPFGVAAFTDAPANEVTSPPVPFINGKTVQRYKVTFNITGLGDVDPDLICTM